MKQFIYTLRYLAKARGTNLIKVLSLTLGLALGLVIFSQVAFERSYDSFFKDSDRLYRVKTLFINHNQPEEDDASDDSGGKGDGAVPHYGVFYPTVQTMLDNFPEVEDGATISYLTGTDRRNYYHEDGLEEFQSNLVYADSSFFRVMGLEVLRGDPAKDFVEPLKVFISDDFAKRFFGNQDPIGKALYNNNKYGYVVVGVFKKLPYNSHLDFDVIMSRATPTSSWGQGGGYWGYIRLKPGADPGAVQSKFADYIRQSGVLKAAEDRGYEFKYTLEPIAEGHIGQEDVKDKTLLLSVVGLCLLLTSVLNYVLISVSTLSSRSRTLAVYKCNGAKPGDIFRMFMYETAVLTLVSTALAALLIFAFRGVVETLVGQPVSALFALSNLWMTGVVLLVVWIIAGVIPGWVFSRVSVMKAFRSTSSAGRMWWKSILLFLQLVAASFILTFLAVIIRQYSYMTTKDLGYKYENVVYIWTLFTNLNEQQTHTVRDEVKKLPFVENVSLVGPAMPLFNFYGKAWIPNENKETILTPYVERADENYLDVLGIKLEAGEDLAPDSPMEQVLINQEAVRQLGWLDNPIGQTLGQTPLTVRGVVKDFHIGSVLENPTPQPVMIMQLMKPTENNPFVVAYIMMRFTEVTPKNIAQLQQAVARVLPDKIVKIKTYKEELFSQYQKELMTRDSIGVTAIFTALITLMGLIGYISYEMRRRRKEIALRKVNGATVKEILVLILLNISVVSVAGVVFGLAAAYYMGGKWLVNFPDKLPFSPWLFAGCALAIWIVIALVVVLQSWSAARENPVKSLKSE